MVEKFIFALLLLIPTLSLIVQPVLAQETKDWKDIDVSAGRGKCVGGDIQGVDASDVATIQGFECLFYNILQVIVFFAGIAFLIMFIYGGYQYLFSGNDPKKTAAASSTLTMAVIGVVGIIISWLILKLIKDFTGLDVINFIIPG
jgi:hypothetical protein